MKAKNNEVKITVFSVAKATFVVMLGYRLGKWAADNLTIVGRAIDHGVKKALVNYIEKKEKEEEQEQEDKSES